MSSNSIPSIPAGQSEERLRALLTAYETVTNNTPDLIYIFDLNYKFTYANQALLKMWGKTWDEAVGKGLLDNGYEPWHAEMHEREIDHVASTKEPIRGVVSFPHATLGKRVYDYIFVPVINALGEVEAVAGTTRDITDIRLAEEALKRSQEELEVLVTQRTKALHQSNADLQQFAHVASHDLKEPMRKIMLFSNRLRNDGGHLLDEKTLQYLDKIEHAAQRMSSMIEGILSYSSFEGAMHEEEAVDLQQTIHAVKDDLEIIIHQKSAKLVYGELPVVIGSHILLSQLFSNLISNALKFSQRDTAPVINIQYEKLSVKEKNAESLHADKEYAKITLTDNGIGFEDQYAERIFQTFSRLNSKEQFEGTGLGLSLCRKIVERHGGVIKAHGEPGKGATFTIILPSSK